jgi:hypothetical protein
MIVTQHQIDTTLFGSLESGYTMTEIHLIMLCWMTDSGKVSELVMMDTQKLMKMVNIVLGVVKVRISKQQPLKYMELSSEESYAKIN